MKKKHDFKDNTKPDDKMSYCKTIDTELIHIMTLFNYNIYVRVGHQDKRIIVIYLPTTLLSGSFQIGRSIVSVI